MHRVWIGENAEDHEKRGPNSDAAWPKLGLDTQWPAAMPKCLNLNPAKPNFLDASPHIHRSPSRPTTRRTAPMSLVDEALSVSAEVTITSNSPHFEFNLL